MLAFGGWVAYAVYLVVQAHQGPLIVWTDSKTYAAEAAAPLWSHALWWGQRPPMTPLLIKVAGSGRSLLTAQALIGALAWGVLAWTVGRLAQPGWRRVAATWLILGFAAALPVTMWNRSELSESLSMSLLALVAAGLIWTARRPTWPRAASTAAAAICFAATRDAQVWTIAMIGGGLCLLVVLRTWRDRGAIVRMGSLAVCLIVAAGAIEWGTLASHRTTGNVANVFYVRVFPYPSRVAWFAERGMPDRQQIERLAATSSAQRGDAKVVAPNPVDPVFRPLERWLKSSAPGAYVAWIATHPWYVLTEPLIRPERSYNYANGNLRLYAAPDDLASPLTPLVWPSLAQLSIVIAVALFLAVVNGAWRLATWRVVAALCAIGVLAMLVAWHGDGQEVTRHTVEGFAELRLALWILVVLGLFGRRSKNVDADVTGETRDQRASSRRALPGKPSSVAPQTTSRANVQSGSSASSA